jgi:hypothetical protein
MPRHRRFVSFAGNRRHGRRHHADRQEHMHRTLAVAAAATILLLVPATPATVLAAPSAAMPSDFDGDGYADLAIGAPQAHARQGSVSVLYGGPKGLTAAGDQLWSQDSHGVRSRGETPDRFGSALASGDFDRDGFADLAIGVPGEDPARPNGFGAVAVLYGSATGLTAEADQLWMAGNVPGAADARALGASLAAGDVDGDGYWDLVAGAPDSRGLDGIAVVLFGGPGGLSADHAQVLDRSMTGAPDATQPAFGRSVAAGDLDGDGLADVAVGSAGEDNPGEISIFPGSGSGADTGAAVLWGPDTPGITTGAGFGRAMAIGDFDHDGFGDLAAGAPGQPIAGPGSGYGAGAVHVIHGSADGLTATGNEVWRQSSPGIPGTDEAFDSFGSALAAGDFDGDEIADLAIGAPGEDWSGDISRGRGAVVIVYGSADGLSGAGSVRFDQDTSGVPNAREAGDRFGYSLAAGRFGRSNPADLAIGVPLEVHHGVRDAGLVTVLYGSGTGLSADHAQAWTKASPGVKGAVAKDHLGQALGH